MDLSCTHLLAEPRPQVWAAVSEPASSACGTSARESLVPRANGRGYEAIVIAHVGAVLPWRAAAARLADRFV